jgi:hypothetical protein
MRIRDPESLKFESGVRAKHPGSATLVPTFKYCTADTQFSDMFRYYLQ